MQEKIDIDALVRGLAESEDSLHQCRTRYHKEHRRLLDLRTNLTAAIGGWQRAGQRAQTPTEAALAFCKQAAAERAANARQTDTVSEVDRAARDGQGDATDPNAFARARMRNGGFRRGGTVVKRRV